jgi:uncharacterized protein (DUF1800 family)
MGCRGSEDEQEAGEADEREKGQPLVSVAPDGVNLHDSRCASSFTPSDRNAIHAAMVAAGRSPLEIFHHAYDRLGHGANAAVTDRPTTPSTVAFTSWDPAQTGTLYTSLAADGLTLTKDDTPSTAIYSTTAAFANKTFTSGKWYFELQVRWMVGGVRQRIGIASTTGRQLNGPGSADYSVGMDYNGTSSIYDPVLGYRNAAMPNPIAVKAGDIIGVSFDLSINKISFYVNNVLAGSLDVVAGKTWSPFLYASNNSNYTAKANFGAQDFRYPVPIGFQRIDPFRPISPRLVTLASIADTLLQDLRSGSQISSAAQVEIKRLFPLPSKSDQMVMWTLIDLYETRNRYANGSAQWLVYDRAALDFRNQLAEELAAKAYLASALHPSIGVGEVLVDFWFNHFNVYSRDTNGTATAYENMIRSSVCGTFSELLLNVARSPAMLQYLNNDISVGKSGTTVLTSGINENYAREVMELHTFGVGPTSGVYDPSSIREVAKILTGWRDERNSVYNAATPGSTYWVFRFEPAVHYPGVKTVPFGNGAGLTNRTFADGEAGGISLLGYLASHSYTKRNICTKLGKRLMSSPPAALVSGCVAAWTQSGGSLPRLLMAYLSSVEFWRDDLQSKLKNPYELALSTHRLLGKTSFTRAAVLRDLDLVRRMGMRMKGLLPPTGYSEDSQDWLSSGYISAGVGMINAIVDVERAALSDPAMSGTTLEAVVADMGRADPDRAYGKMASDVLPFRLATPWTAQATGLLKAGVTPSSWDSTNSGTPMPVRTYSALFAGSRWFFVK